MLRHVISGIKTTLLLALSDAALFLFATGYLFYLFYLRGQYLNQLSYCS